MPAYDVTVTETVVRRKVFHVEADHESDAAAQAYDEAENSDFGYLPSDEVEYDVADVRVVEDYDSVDRLHEECYECALQHAHPPQCDGHPQGTVACPLFEFNSVERWSDPCPSYGEDGDIHGRG
jgi:hypothetical protein